MVNIDSKFGQNYSILVKKPTVQNDVNNQQQPQQPETQSVKLPDAQLLLESNVKIPLATLQANAGIILPDKGKSEHYEYGSVDDLLSACEHNGKQFQAGDTVQFVDEYGRVFKGQFVQHWDGLLRLEASDGENAFWSFTVRQ